MTFIGSRLAAVRWRQWRLYPVEFLDPRGNPSTSGYMGTIRETTDYPRAYNIESDPTEEVNVMHTNAWLIAPYQQLINGLTPGASSRRLPCQRTHQFLRMNRVFTISSQRYFNSS
ncbi:MAG: hypothetical protein GY869_19965 [Planctomycetes bacterium]|nr:hypothetical protein [Planctomycetota bacterium]